MGGSTWVGAHGWELHAFMSMSLPLLPLWPHLLFKERRASTVIVGLMLQVSSTTRAWPWLGEMDKTVQVCMETAGGMAGGCQASVLRFFLGLPTCKATLLCTPRAPDETWHVMP